MFNTLIVDSKNHTQFNHFQHPGYIKNKAIPKTSVFFCWLQVKTQPLVSPIIFHDRFRIIANLTVDPLAKT